MFYSCEEVKLKLKLNPLSIAYLLTPCGVLSNLAAERN